MLKAFKLAILVFHSSTFLTDRSKAVLLYLCSPLTYCLVCVLQPCGHLLGKGLRPSSPVRQVQHLLDPLFWLSMLSTVFLYLVSVLFSLSLPLILFNHATIVFTETLGMLRMSLIDIAKVLKQAVTEIWVMGRVAGKP